MAPLRLAFDNPIAIACLGLFVLCFPSCMCSISSLTISCAFGPYFREPVERRAREVVRVRLLLAAGAEVRLERVERFATAVFRLLGVAVVRRERVREVRRRGREVELATFAARVVRADERRRRAGRDRLVATTVRVREDGAVRRLRRVVERVVLRVPTARVVRERELDLLVAIA